MSDKFVNIIRNMYSKVRATVNIGNILYDTIKDECGTNQGGHLSPNMFRFMLADFKYFYTNYVGIVLDDEILVLILWADDLLFMSDTTEGLQKLLNGLFEFCERV